MKTLLQPFLLAGALGLSLSAWAQTPQAAPPRPNIVLILTDDMGWSDLGCMGSEIATPNLDALAAKGLRFTQFYNTARCCPTRASLLTGLYPHRAGIGHMMEDKGQAGYRGDLNSRCVTIAEALRPAGYRTYAVGKWHVTRHNGPDGPKDNWPLQRGFERYYGTIHGAGSYFDPATLTRDNTAISPFADPEYRPETYYYTDAIAEHAVRFIGQHEQATPGQPFFIYVAFTAAHWPLHALPTDIARQRGKYDAGYQPTLAARLAKQKQLGLVDPHWSAVPPVGDWDKLADRRWETACMEVYAAQVASMDRGVGQIVAELKRTGQLDNTLVLYLQDNGACAEAQGRTGNAAHPEQARTAQPTLPPLAPGALLPPGSVPPQTREGHPVLMGKKELPGPADTYMAYGEAWAHVSNTPFREYKHWVHEGGIATPLIAHWPKGIPTGRHGQLEPQPGHLVDIMATCLDLARAPYPAARHGEPTVPPAGVSLRPAFSGQSLQRPESLCWEHEGNRALRDGRWKLVAKGPGRPWELYDMAADRTEMHDLAAQQPERTRSLAAQWEAWARAQDVLPWLWQPAYSNAAPTAASPPTRPRQAAEAGSRAEKQAPDLRFTPAPSLPNVLLLGDSISIGYTRPVRQLLTGKANVFRPLNAKGAAENCSDTGKGLTELDRWLALAPKWDVIHFNWGLHDLKHTQDGQPSSDPNAPPLRSLEEYRANLAKIVTRLKATGAHLVWASTTPVVTGTGNPFRNPEDPPRYNAAAAAVMTAHGVHVNDLFALVQPRLATVQLPKNVHFTPAGSDLLARQVADAVLAELPPPAQAP
jgi:arylsulfatase